MSFDKYIVKRLGPLSETQNAITECQLVDPIVKEYLHEPPEDEMIWTGFPGFGLYPNFFLVEPQKPWIWDGINKLRKRGLVFSNSNWEKLLIAKGSNAASERVNSRLKKILQKAPNMGLPLLEALMFCKSFKTQMPGIFNQLLDAEIEKAHSIGQKKAREKKECIPEANDLIRWTKDDLNSSSATASGEKSDYENTTPDVIEMIE